MNLEEMKKIWNSETQETLYAIDQEGMSKIVNRKRAKTLKRVSLVENLVMWMNIILPTGLVILTIVANKPKASVYIMSTFMFLTAAYIGYFRNKRLNSYKNWGKSMLDTLEEAIHNASYQARLSKTILVWYLLGIAIISISMLIAEGKPLWLISIMLGFFVLAFFVGKWEQRAFHDRYRDELISLKEKLVS